MGENSTRKVRRDGWTAERQLRFLDALSRTRSVAGAAASAGMSREGAYRLRNRTEGGLFALLWDCALTADPSRCEVHTSALSDGQLARLLGHRFRRERGDSWASGPRQPERATRDRTVRL
jgi:hypothetical protein